MELRHKWLKNGQGNNLKGAENVPLIYSETKVTYMRKIASSANFVFAFMSRFIIIITGDITRLVCHKCVHFSLQPN